MSDTLEHDERANDSVRLSESERSGNPRSLGAAWAGVLLAPGTIITGMVAAGGSAGPGFALGFGGLATGIIIGTICVALISVWGPRTGLAAMPIGRLAFGAANFLPQIFLLFSMVAYDSLNNLFGVNALADALKIPFGVALACIVAVEVVVVVFGVRLMRVLGLILSSIMLVVSIWLIIGARDVTPDPMPIGTNVMPAMLLAVALGLSMSVSWTVQACDLSRTLPARTSPRGVVVWVFIGMTVPLLVLTGIGAWVSTDAALSDPMGRISSLLGGGLPAVIALIALGTSLAVGNAFNDFSGGLSLVQLGVKLPRVAASLIITALGVTLAIISRNTNLGTLTEDITLLAGYWTTPWLGIIIIELLARRTDPKPWRRPILSGRAAAWAFLLGMLLLMPFTATPIGNQLAADSPVFAWIGWVSRNMLNGGDLAYFAGVLFGAVIYAVLRKRLGVGPQVVESTESAVVGS